MTFLEFTEALLECPFNFLESYGSGVNFFNIEIEFGRIKLMGKYNASAIANLPEALLSTGKVTENGFTSFEATSTIPIDHANPEGGCWSVRLVFT